MPAPLWALSRISSNDMIPSLPPNELGYIDDATAGLGTWGYVLQIYILTTYDVYTRLHSRPLISQTVGNIDRWRRS